MKRALVLSAVAASVSCAYAQSSTPASSVTLYGIVDTGFTRVTGVGGGVNQLASGIMEGSRWGVRGNEDLGGGFRAIFTLEARLESDTGLGFNRPISGSRLPEQYTSAARLGLPAALQPVVTGVAANIGNTVGVNLNNTTFDRQAFLGLVTPVGAILAGRQYTPAYEVSATFDTMKTESSLSAGQVASVPASIDIRYSNTLAYRIQAAGFTGSLMYGLGEVAGNNSANRLMGAMVMYKADRFSVGVGHNTRNNELGQKSLTSTVLGASVRVGPGDISAQFADIKNDNPAGLSGIAAGLPAALTGAQAAAVQNAFINAFKQKGRLMHVGYRFNLNPTNQISVAYSRYDDKRPANADVTSYGAAYTYSFSKRTDVNFVYTRFNNSANAQLAPGQAGYLGGVTDAPGRDANSFAISLRHRF